ncbi:hypothetical protein [Thermofilum pendens]|uniref:Uncharacterized protein n=1 Tax=Thermofilum pendens (strain DSM 2475 / Hrk 5) TaxID=368408 RepID=A1RZF7_THEPD|nr:hypothetical protein [Thermofilum pendens]ABL78587.1 hypothetical protein Tpen_1189 [Thermofilum pendens Hrk 5]
MRGLLALLVALAVSAALISVAVALGSLPYLAGPPPPPKPPAPAAHPEGSGRLLTREEKETLLSVLRRDSFLAPYLSRSNWTVKNLDQLRVYPGSKVEALVELAEPQWIEGLETPKYRASMWARTLIVTVNLTAGRVERVEAVPTRPPRDTPLSPRLEEARRVAASHRLVQSLGPSVNLYLVAVYHSGEYPGGLAVFSAFSDKGEVLVAVDLATMTVVERYTSPVYTP